MQRKHLLRCPIQPVPETVGAVKADACLSWCTISGERFCRPSSRTRVGWNGIVKVGFADFTGMPGCGPCSFITPNGIGRDPRALWSLNSFFSYEIIYNNSYYYY